MRVLLVDDHHLFRQGLKFILEDLDETIQFTETGTCEQALELEPAGHIDLILLDFRLPGIEGLEALREIRKCFESAPVVVLSGEDNPRIIRETIDHGAAGFIPKSSTPEVLIAALRLILADGIYLPPHALHEAPASAKPVVSSEAPAPPGDQLSGRQREVLLRVVQGKPNKVVARELDISEGTVKAHLSAAFRVLGVRNRTEAVYVAARLGLSAPRPSDA